MNMIPDLYHISNTLQKRDAKQCLEEYGKEIKWNKYGATVIDIGCGDGSVTTSILKSFLPNNCKELVGCDINEKMTDFAIAHHAKDFIKFTVLDIESDLPDRLREKFDHAFSFYVLNWIKHQKLAFSNIYDLLVRGGDCLLMFMGHLPVYDVWRELARIPRWNYWLKDVDCFVSPYHDCQDPEKDIKIMITNIGFTNVEVKCLQKEFVYGDIETFKNSIKALNPFNIPFEMLEDFLEDYLKLARDMKLGEHTFNNNIDGTLNVVLSYKTIIVYGKKIAFSNIYDLLTKGGDCLLMFLAYMPVYDVWQELARASRWNYWLKDVERFVPPYQDCQDPENDVKKIMASIGFSNVKVKCHQKVYVYTAFKNAMNAINPFKIPLEMQEDFLENSVKVVRDMGLVEHTNNDIDGTLNVKMNYKLIIAYGKK